jgi:hypothetical protein
VADLFMLFTMWTHCAITLGSRVIMMRTVRRWGTGQDPALAGLPPSFDPSCVTENMRQGQEIRSELSTALTRSNIRWRDVDGYLGELAYR